MRLIKNNPILPENNIEVDFTSEESNALQLSFDKEMYIIMYCIYVYILWYIMHVKQIFTMTPLVTPIPANGQCMALAMIVWPPFGWNVFAACEDGNEKTLGSIEASESWLVLEVGLHWFFCPCNELQVYIRNVKHRQLDMHGHWYFKNGKYGSLRKVVCYYLRFVSPNV